MRDCSWLTGGYTENVTEKKYLVGATWRPYGIEPSRKTLEALFRYSYEQGLASRELTIEELFHPSTVGFSEKMS